MQHGTCDKRAFIGHGRFDCVRNHLTDRRMNKRHDNDDDGGSASYTRE